MIQLMKFYIYFRQNLFKYFKYILFFFEEYIFFIILKIRQLSKKIFYDINNNKYYRKKIFKIL